MTPAIDGNTRLYAIIGDPVSPVRSPQHFNALFETRRINAAMFALHVSAEDLRTAWAGLDRVRNLHGMVVTMPHKVAACELVDRLEPTAQLVGGINAARRDPDGRWTGAMFDGEGCVLALRDRGHQIAGRSAFLLGVGGAGAAIAAALADASIAELVVCDIDEHRHDATMARIAKAYPRTKFRSGDVRDGSFDFAINATPLGLRADDPLPFDPRALPRSTVVVEVIATPEMTPLLLQASQSGHAIQTGRHLHEGQAVGAARFFGFEV